MEPDIKKKIDKDFSSQATMAYFMIVKFEEEMNLSPRVTRSIIYLAKGSVAELAKVIEEAKTDWRDVITMAETFTFQFNKPFE